MSHFSPTPSSQIQPEVETTTKTATAILKDNWDTPQTRKARASAKISKSECRLDTLHCDKFRICNLKQKAARRWVVSILNLILSSLKALPVAAH